MKKLLIICSIFLSAFQMSEAYAENAKYISCGCTSNGYSTDGIWGYTLHGYYKDSQNLWSFNQKDNLGDFFDEMSEDKNTKSSQLIGLRQQCETALFNAKESNVCP